MKPRPTVQRRLLLVGCWISFAVLPIAHTITSAAAREASSPVEETPAGFSEAALVRHVECREPSGHCGRTPGSPCCSNQPDSTVSPCLLLSGHRWANGLLAPLRT